MGAHLATITSQAENDWIFNNVVNGNRVWLGGTDEGHEGTWNWITNETWNYTKWDSGEPNNINGGENSLDLEPNGSWNDAISSGSMLYLCEWEPTPTINVYSNDFSTSAGAEWTDSTIATSNGEKFLGTSAYGFGAGSNTLTLNNLPTHTAVTVDFDLYIIQSWDGNGENGWGPDNWQLTADGNNLLLTNFSHCSGQTQAYPDQLSPYGTGGSFAPYAGTFAVNHLGFGTGCWGDSTYRLSYTFNHTAASVVLKFKGMENQAPGDEGWGLDNVKVSVTPPPVTLPVVSTNLPSVVTATTAKLSGTVNPKGAVTTASFDFGTTMAYGTNIAATPTIAATAGATAVSADKTGLTCNTTYHYRVKATNSAGTATGNDKSFTTSNTCNPDTWLYPLTQTTTIGSDFSLDVHVNTNGVKLGGYNLGVTFDPSKIWVDTTYQNAAKQCDDGVCPGTGALASNNVITDNTAGTIRLAGFDNLGTGPSNDLQVAVIHFVARAATPATPVNLTATELLDPLGGNIGSLATRGATVKIDNYKCGDADGNGSVNIVDALAIARQVVDLPPPPTVNAQAADVNGDGIVGIADAMFIARNSVGLLVVGTCLQ
jgi:hypothetical protein